MRISPAYLAGFFDGEGCIRIQKHLRDRYGVGVSTHHQLSCVIGNTHAEIMHAIRGQFGGGYVLDKRTGKHRDCHRLTWAGAKAVELIRVMYPYLIVKREQADAALAFYEFQQFHHVSGKAYAADKVVQMSEIADRVAAMNKRGVS